MFEISDDEWRVAREIQQQLLEAPNEMSRKTILARHSSNGIILGDLGTTYLARYHEMQTSEGPKPIGIQGLNHNFISINNTLYAIANEHDSPLLGQGTFGQVFLGQNSQGKACAIKKESTRRHHPNEVDALDRMGYLQGKAQINDNVYTIMDVFPGTSLMKIHEKGKTADPWQAAAQELGYNLVNLAEVKKKLMGYDDFDDTFSYDLIRTTMSQGTASFTQEDLEKLKGKAADIQQNNSYTPKERTLFALASAQKMKDAFDAKLLHRDIKGDNFVGQVNSDGSVRVAMIDFGGAIEIEKAAGDESAVGSPTYMAPEVLRSLPIELLRKVDRNASITPGPANFSTASDVFSFAIMCELDFGLDDNAGFGILKLAQATEPSNRPSIEEVICLLKFDLALQSNNSTEQKQALAEIQTLKPSVCITDTLKNKLAFKLMKANLTEIRAKANPAEKQNNDDAKENKPNVGPRRK